MMLPCENKRYFAQETAVIEPGAKIGRDCKIWHFVYIGSEAVIGDRCKIQNGVSIFNGVTIEDDVFIGPHVCFTNVYNPRAFIPRMKEARPTVVKRGASIGANATIVCGVTIGEYALVGAGAVVNEDVDPYTIVVGVPARPLRKTDKEGR